MSGGATREQIERVIREFDGATSSLSQQRMAAALIAARGMVDDKLQGLELTANAAIEVIGDCRVLLGLDRGASLTEAVKRMASEQIGDVAAPIGWAWQFMGETHFRERREDLPKPVTDRGIEFQVFRRIAGGT